MASTIGIEKAGGGAARRTAGFTIVEITVAVTILSVGVMAMIGLFTTVLQSQAATTNLVQGTEAVQSKLEELRAIAAAGTADTTQLAVGGSLVTPQHDHSDTTSAGAGRPFVLLWKVWPGPGGSRRVTVRGEPRYDLPFNVPPVDVTTQVLLR